MRVSSIASYNITKTPLKHSKKAEPVPQPPCFKGELGQQAGLLVGGIAGLILTAAAAPMVALAATGAAMLGGAVAGGKIEDKMDDSDARKKGNKGGKN